MAKRTRVFHGNQYTGSFVTGDSRGRAFIRKLSLYASFYAILAVVSLQLLVVIGVLIEPGEVTAELRQVERVVLIKDESVPPILADIAECESYSSHYCTEELVEKKACSPSEVGQVLVKANKNGTVDVGKYAINQYYQGKKAADLGLNIFDEQDNEAYAIHLFNTEGSVPWKPSGNCWAK